MIGPAVRLGAALAVRPLTVVHQGAGCALDLLRIGADGRPEPLGRAGRAVRDAVAGLVDAADLHPADAARLHDAVDGAFALLGLARPAPAPVTALAPAGGLPGTPAGGPQRSAAPAAPPVPPPAAAPLLPAARIGSDVAATPGGVVVRTSRYELIQYLPQTEVVRAVPLLVVPPPGRRHYLVDLGPGRSAVEHLVRHDQQVFALSWSGDGAGDLAAYVAAVREALLACERIVREPRVALLALGAGEAIVAAVTATAPERVAAVTVVAEPDAGAEFDAARAWLADELPVPEPVRRALAAVPPLPGAYRVPDPTQPWWAEHAEWLAARSGDARDAPPELGGRGIYALAPTPGDYVQG